MHVLLRLAASVAIVLAGVVLYAIWVLELPEPAPPARGATLEGVTVVNPGAGRLVGQDLVVEGREIASITPTAGGEGPYAGHFVLPGLADAHVHFPPAAIPGQTQLFAFLFLYHGVTIARDAGDVDGTASNPALVGIRDGRFAGPKLRACGPFIDGPETIWANSIVAEDEAAAREAVRAVAKAGYHCVKAYGDLAPEVAAAIRDEATAQGLPLIGHVPWRMRYEDARFDDVQHLIGIPERLEDPSTPYPANQVAWTRTSPARLAAIARFSREEGIANTPTLVVSDRNVASADLAALEALPEAQLLPRFYREVIWSPVEGMLRDMDDEGRATLAAAWPTRLRSVKALFDAGAPLRTGTDVLNPFIVPGASLHRELRLFVEAGLSAEEALAASRDTAQALGGGRTGWLEAGAPADLLVFREDPTTDLAQLDTLEAVVADGRLFPREILDAELAAFRAAFERDLYDAITLPIVRRALRANID